LKRDFPQLKLVLFGRALLNPDREREFEMLIENLGLKDSVVGLGIVSDAMLKQVYRRADVFVFPSLYEGFGLPLLEALACGACVLGGANAITAEVAGNAAELVDVSDPTRPRVEAKIVPPFPAHDVVFAPGGKRVWISSGTERRRRAGSPLTARL